MPDKTPKRQAEDLKDLLVGYLKQETLDPLRNSGRYLGFGIGGALLVGLGVLLAAFGALRALQTETRDAFDGNWSIAPYLIVILLLVAGAGACVAAVRKNTSSKGSS